MELGSLEYSVEYIRLWNLVSRCRSCKVGRRRKCSVSKPEWIGKVKTLTPGNKVRAPKKSKRLSGEKLPCIYHCNRIHEDDIAIYDLVRFEEMKEYYTDFEDDIEDDATMTMDRIKIELTALV